MDHQRIAEVERVLSQPEIRAVLEKHEMWRDMLVVLELARAATVTSYLSPSGVEVTRSDGKVEVLTREQWMMLPIDVIAGCTLRPLEKREFEELLEKQALEDVLYEERARRST